MKVTSRLFVLIFIGLLLSKRSSAQCVGCCLDSTLIYSTLCIDTIASYSYAPVCGCNGKTYTNECSMHKHGVSSFQYSGPCDPLDFLIYPNPVSNENTTGLNLIIAVKAATEVEIYIFDVFAKQYFFEIIPDIDPSIYPFGFPLTIPVENLHIGLYFLIVKTPSGYFKIGRFEKQGY